MNTIKTVFATLLCSLIASSALGQPAPGASAGRQNRPPDWGGRMSKLFGKNNAFSAAVEVTVQERGDKALPGKLAFDSGKSRFEIDLLQAGPGNEAAAAHMKSLGMDKMVLISRPDKNLAYQVYPGLKAYVQTPLAEGGSPDSYKLQTTELGKETVDGHPTVKRKAVLTDDQGSKYELTVWNATDLKEFPIKIQDGSATTLFKDVKFAKPDASLFEAPTSLTRYDSMQAMMQQEMMKRMGQRGQSALPPGHPPIGEKK